MKDEPNNDFFLFLTDLIPLASPFSILSFGLIGPYFSNICLVDIGNFGIYHMKFPFLFASTAKNLSVHRTTELYAGEFELKSRVFDRVPERSNPADYCQNENYTKREPSMEVRSRLAVLRYFRKASLEKYAEWSKQQSSSETIQTIPPPNSISWQTLYCMK